MLVGADHIRSIGIGVLRRTSLLQKGYALVLNIGCLNAVCPCDRTHLSLILSHPTQKGSWNGNRYAFLSLFLLRTVFDKQQLSPIVLHPSAIRAQPGKLATVLLSPSSTYELDCTSIGWLLPVELAWLM